MKLLVTALLLLLSSIQPLSGEIIASSQIEEISSHVDDRTLIFFNIAEVLTNTETSLGSSSWRRYLRSRVDSNIHDLLTLYVFKHVPSKSADSQIPLLIQSLQEQGIAVLAFTSRGRNAWYSSNIQKIDLITEKVLFSLGLDFSKTTLPPELKNLSIAFSNYYHDGIIYAGNTLEKGALLEEILDTTNYRPSKIIFVDDKIDSLQGIEEALECLHIPFIGLAYEKTKISHQNFDPMIATIQLEWLMLNQRLLSDEEALRLKNDMFSDIDPENYFRSLIDHLSSFLTEETRAKLYTEVSSKNRFMALRKPQASTIENDPIL
ncbi:MAG: DUF2608 domain-containing protein [Parachlamydiaceae bacterium]